MKFYYCCYGKRTIASLRGNWTGFFFFFNLVVLQNHSRKTTVAADQGNVYGQPVHARLTLERINVHSHNAQPQDILSMVTTSCKIMVKGIGRTVLGATFISTIITINPCHVNVPTLYPLKTSANQRFFDIFRGYINRTQA